MKFKKSSISLNEELLESIKNWNDTHSIDRINTSQICRAALEKELNKKLRKQERAK